MADETVNLDDDFDTQSSERRTRQQKSWLAKNFDQSKPQTGPDGFPISQAIKKGSAEEARIQAGILKNKLKQKEKVLSQKRSEVDELEQSTEDRALRSKKELEKLREAAPQCAKTERCETRYNPRWGSTEAIRKQIREAIGRVDNESLDDVVNEITTRALAGGQKAGWSGKITFCAAIVRQDKFQFKDNFAKWWYYEYDLDGKYFFIFMKVDHDRQ